MWKSIGDGTKTYVLKRYALKCAFKLIVSDFTHVWAIAMTDNELLAIFQEQNPLLEFNEDEFTTQNIWTIVDNHLDSRGRDDGSLSSLHLNIIEDCSLHFRFNGKMDCLAFKLNLTLLQENNNIFFDEVTSSLLSLAQVLLSQQDHLFSLLEKKDIEISEYKLAGATLSRRNIQTPPFNKNEFLSGYQDCNSNMSEGISKVVDVLNLVSKQKTTTSSECDIIPGETADSSSAAAQIPSAKNIPVGAEVNANQIKQDAKTTVLRIPKKKRTKLNL